MKISFYIEGCMNIAFDCEAREQNLQEAIELLNRML